MELQTKSGKEKTSMKILTLIGAALLLILFAAGCGEQITGTNQNQSQEKFYRPKVVNLNSGYSLQICTNGAQQKQDSIIVESDAGFHGLSFDAITDADSTNYQSAISIFGWNGGSWYLIRMFSSGYYINGFHSINFENQQRVKFMEQIWYDEPYSDTAMIKAWNIEFR